MGKIEYNDEWIIEYWEFHRNWNSLCNSYNEHFNTNVGYNTFKSHCNRELKLNFHYSEEQDAWLKENYPKLGRVKAKEVFNKKFNTNRTSAGMRVHCERMGLRVSGERKKLVAIENTKRYWEKDTIVEKDHGYLWIKLENGKWEQLQRFVYKQYYELKEGFIVIFLDGNNRNFDIENLVAIPRQYSAKMTKNEFWSEFSEVTKTGIIWCELDDIFKKENKK
jgi:hypothetical protein